jgi:1-acyl-sn-glycerol-3-phosphate acyltransferase
MGDFKAGSFKMARMSGGYIVPVTIDGSWRFLYYPGKVTGGRVDITIHPAIAVESLSPAEWKDLPGKVHDTIASAIHTRPVQEALLAGKAQ